MEYFVSHIVLLGGVAGAIMTIVGLIIYIHKAVVTPIKAIKADFISQVDELTKQLSQIQESNSTASTATMRMIRDKITQAHTHFTGQGHIGKYELESILGLAQSYKELDGNSFVIKLITELEGLPIREEGQNESV